ncbi:ATP-binding protein [uncultured Nevskia sp.]|uniref:ATP-binding protein n=1 Tax=uncultured Nevskia sp. TaxID=228950 RepID=UPI0025E8CD26|nr:ATP-binding protein [uncultured Nevskia sp.]
MTALPAPPRRFSLLDSLGETANHQNAMLLVQLRWLAVFGQALTIGLSTVLFDLQLPMATMFGVVGVLVLFNLYSMLRPRPDREVRDSELMTGLFIDITALTALLYLSGGATNPFVFLYLMQVTLGAILLEMRSTWVLVAYSCVCFVVLIDHHVPLVFGEHAQRTAFDLHVLGMLVCFVLDILLLVVFIRQIGTNLRRRDRNLADLRQHAAEEDHIVRMGLLASGAAHELGTPLSTLSVIIGDWRHLPEFREHPDLRQELDDVDAELRRIKDIVNGILLSAGEARGERPILTTVAHSLGDTVDEWRSLWPGVTLDYVVEEPLDREAFHRTPVVSDSAMRQVLFNVFDNAREVSPSWIGVTVRCRDSLLTIDVRDHGPGFPQAMLARIGKPYQSSKNRPGSGLGLFLVVNVLRKFGGHVDVINGEHGGAIVRLQLPLSALVFERGEGGA